MGPPTALGALREPRARLAVDGDGEVEVVVPSDEPVVLIRWGGREIACVVVPAIGTLGGYSGAWSLGRQDDSDRLHRPLMAHEFLVAIWRGEEAGPEEIGEFVRLHRGVLPGAEEQGLDRLCPVCAADLVGNDPHGPGCPRA